MALFSFTDKSILYFPGCFSSAFLKDKVENYRKILRKIDVNPRFSEDFACCGGIIEEAGYEKQFRKIARDNFAILKKMGVKKIITNCPLCYSAFTIDYKEMLPDWNIKVEFVLESILEKIRENPKIVKNYLIEPIAYYDSCYLSRYIDLSKTARELLPLLGYSVMELPSNKEETLCCGSCGGLIITNKELADEIAIDFIKMLREENIKKVVTADSQAFKHLKENLRALSIKEEEIKILEFSDILCKALGIKIEQSEEEKIQALIEGGR